MNINVQPQFLGFGVQSTSLIAPTNDVSFDTFLQEATGAEQPKFPILDLISTVVDQAASQGKLTSTDKETYLALLEDIKEALEEMKPKHPDHLKPPMAMTDSGISGFPLALFGPNPVAFLLHTKFLSMETQSVDACKAWVVDGTSDSCASQDKAQFLAFLELREKFVAMLTQLSGVFGVSDSTNAGVAESQASSSQQSILIEQIPTEDGEDTAVEGTEVAAETASVAESTVSETGVPVGDAEETASTVV